MTSKMGVTIPAKSTSKVQKSLPLLQFSFFFLGYMLRVTFQNIFFRIFGVQTLGCYLAHLFPLLTPFTSLLDGHQKTLF